VVLKVEIILKAVIKLSKLVFDEVQWRCKGIKYIDATIL